jgi:cyclic beta-1,2-glucan synthetase
MAPLKISNMFALLNFRRLKALVRRQSMARRSVEPEPALRSELFSADQMDMYGPVLAGKHRLSEMSAENSLLVRLADNETILLHTCELLTAATRTDRRITPAGEWLLDNYYVIEEQIRIAQRHFPKGYSRELPLLAGGPSRGLPRVYDIALETISHSDAHLDNESLRRFVASYQTVSPLKMGELWAIPIMLRLALIENLRRVAARVIADWRDRNLAAQWADTMTEIAEKDPKSIVLAVADMARSNPPMASSFVAELTRRLQGQSSALALPLTWIEQRLSESGLSVEHLLQIEAQQQAADQVSIGNSIGSLRALSTMDWREFVESMSVVEHTLREDPADTYAAMDFATRDHYRHVVERLARNSKLNEQEVAQAAIALSRERSQEGGGPCREVHVGFYLVDVGLPVLEKRVATRLTFVENLQRLIDTSPLTFYLGLIALFAMLLAWPAIATARRNGFPDWVLVVLVLPAMLLGSQLAVGLVNWLVTLTIRPQIMPRMDYAFGIPEQARTLVVIPTMFSCAEHIEDLVESLEVRFLGNRDEYLHFALLTDFKDAPTEVIDADAALLVLARERIDELNAKYPGASADRFFLFHRPRRFNKADKIWMGYERKRGKISELNALLRGGGRERFSLIVGNIEPLRHVRYVITLDTDTQLPRDSAREFVGAMAHPLNRAIYDADKRRVTSGYAILQPRVGVSLPSTARSSYARLFGSEAGIDPYTRAVSDVYQDLFGEGSFIGKGIYDVDAFEKANEGRFPDNRILSHDLIEGCYARSGLLSDVQLYEEYPAHYDSDISRRHRWIRGDWQLLPWLLPWAPTRDNGGETNPLSTLSRWKILDNLRRSLVPAALLVLLLFGWIGIAQVVPWTLAVLAVVLVPPLLSSLLELFHRQRDVLLDQHLRTAMRISGQHFMRAALNLAWLPHEALYSLDAIVRTLWRMIVSHRRLLQWRPSRDVESASTNDLVSVYRLMWIGPLMGVAMAVALTVWRPLVLNLAVPFLLLWIASPAIAWWMSKPPTHATFAPSADDRRFLRALARKTWAFFETHVGPEDHWLPPDNIQEEPIAVVAHRTSPTNMGMALLANLAAYDFGYVTSARLLARTAHTLQTMEGLERYRSHFYNWYDTLTLRPLPPQYVSAVDSGNLAGHLLTLRPGLLMIADDPVFSVSLLEGLADCLGILRRALLAEGHNPVALDAFEQDLEAALESPPPRLTSAANLMRRLTGRIEVIASTLNAVEGGDVAFWTHALATQCADIDADLAIFSKLPRLEGGLEGPGGAGIPTLREMAQLNSDRWPEPERAMADEVRRVACDRVGETRRLAQMAGDMALMEFGFLYDAGRDLLSIGYNVDERRLDASYYDLLASEARLANFVAIAQGQLPQESWFTLGRLLTTTGGVPVLLSWSGSMFEYLMPMLVMPTYEGTLLDQTCRAAVARQIEYGSQLGLAWGVSESGYNTRDVQFNYQYRAFGVPGLGLKRGLGEDMVIAPYATALALMVAPEEASLNLRRLANEGLEGRFGLYEAVDYTPARLSRGQSSAVVQSFMAHHQGMSLLSLAYVLLDRPMQKRFESDPQFQATTLLLQERIPKNAAEYLHASGFPARNAASRAAENKLRVFTDPNRSRPAVQLLSNGRYHVMVTSAGGGYSRSRDMAVTRWREDITCDNWGMFCYLRDVASGEYWSSAHQPTLKRPEVYEAIFSDARAEFRVREREFDAHTEIVVSPEDDIELRRIRLTNRARTRRTIEVTSYAEVVLAPAVADAAHPAFSNLFVQTELIEPLQAIISTRRPRSSDEQVPWMCHLLAVHDAHIDEISYETDRSRFIGRGRGIANPMALDSDASGHARLSNSQGSVLDPIISIRCRITLDPGESATVDMVSGVGDTREACLHLIEKYRDRHLADRVFDLAWTHSQVLLRQLNASLSDAQLYEQMAASVIYANASMRADPSVLIANQRGQSGLWGQSISGDLPIVLLQIADPANIELVRQLVQAHAYWRLKGLVVDLVIWNEDHAGYRQRLQDLIMGLIASGIEANLIDRPGGIFVRPAQQLSNEDRILMQSVARVILSDSRGSLAEQIGRRRVEKKLPRFDPARNRPHAVIEAAQPPHRMLESLILRNPLGGFSADGTEYVVSLAAGQDTPAPWVNVLANPDFGTVVSESGSAYTWTENAHEFRLTPWHNDPISDITGEAIYIRDEETGHFWSPTPLPRRGTGSYTTRHGFGYSVFEHSEDGIVSELWVYVAIDTPVKFSVLKLRNESGRARQLSVTGYVEWVLGDLREKSAMHVVTESDPLTGALFARNAYNAEFRGRTAFFDVEGNSRSSTGNRSEFVGRNGNLRAPAAMSQDRLSGQTGAGLDPCAAIQVSFDLGDGEERDVIFRLGVGRDPSTASALVQRLRGSGTASAALEAVHVYWRWTLSKVQVHTPDPSVDVLVNGWLMYQTIVCRFWARSGFYQSGGAIGFRDQLQDSMAMIHAAPHSARQHLLLCAAHQFPEGDVQHWWHPPQDRGVRTHCSDDYLWLPLATSRYVLLTADTGVLDEMAGYIEGRQVNADEEAYYDLARRSDLRETLYQHCVRAIERGMRRGIHGLPLIGTGDWNDGMNRVGEHGLGESVWLAFFLYDVLVRFAVVARLHKDEAFAERCEDEAAALRTNIEENGWDGDWYRRAYYDNGAALGTAGASECQIDSIAQSWSVLSGAGSHERRRRAMNSLDRRLVRRDAGLVQLLDPPFDKTELDPGYIKGYVPGVRENGGQYTHAAIWATMAFAELGDSERAWELLRMINPVAHGLTAEGIDTYKIEPYVVAADVYAVSPHIGRGGWSWYTGSAGWMYRLIVESLLGVRLEGERLRILPVIPAQWSSFGLDYRFRETDYFIKVRQIEGEGDAVDQVILDGVVQADGCIPLIDDGRDHHVDIYRRRDRPGLEGA